MCRSELLRLERTVPGGGVLWWVDGTLVAHDAPRGRVDCGWLRAGFPWGTVGVQGSLGGGRSESVKMARIVHIWTCGGAGHDSGEEHRWRLDGLASARHVGCWLACRCRGGGMRPGCCKEGSRRWRPRAGGWSVRVPGCRGCGRLRLRTRQREGAGWRGSRGRRPRCPRAFFVLRAGS